MNWKPWLRAMLIFAAVCVLGDVIITYGVIYRTPSYDTNRIRHVYDENPDEIPMFGASKVRIHYDPVALGLNAYNYGMDGSSFEVTDVLLQIELAKPKTTPIIIEPEFEDTHGLADPAKFIPLLSDSRFRQLMRKFKMLSWREYIPGLRYFGQYDFYVREYINERLWTSWKLVNGYNYDTRPPPFSRARLDETIQRRRRSRTGYFPDPDQERRLIAHITAHTNRVFFLVYSPYHSSCFANFQNADQLKAFQDRLKAIPNAVVIDWSRLDYPDEYFFDTVHMHREGVVDFSHKLGDKIRQVLKERQEQTAGNK